MTRTVTLTRTVLAFAVLTSANACVKDGISPTGREIARIIISPGGAQRIVEDQNLRLTAVAVDASNREIPNHEITWRVEDDAVASVDGGGLVRAVSVGSTVVEAASGSHTATVALEVASAVASATVTAPRDSLIPSVFDTTRIAIQLRDAANNPLTRAVQWSSSDPTILTIDATTGLARGILPGTARVTASGPGFSFTKDIRVLPAVARIVVTLDTRAVPLGETMRPTAQLLAANDQPITGRPVTWTASGTAVTVNPATGAVTTVRRDTVRLRVASENAQVQSDTFRVSAGWRTVAIDRSPFMYTSACAVTNQGQTYCWGNSEYWLYFPSQNSVCGPGGASHCTTRPVL